MPADPSLISNPFAALSFIAAPAVLTQTYKDPTVKAKVPFAAELLKAVQQGQPRPVSPVYPQISQAIYDNVYAALGKRRPEATEHDLRKALDEVLSGKPVGEPRTHAIGCYIPSPGVK